MPIVPGYFRSWGVKQKSHFEGVRTAFDPTATFTVRCGNSFDAGLVAHANVRGSHVTMSRC
jgi:hypothetical protein